MRKILKYGGLVVGAAMCFRTGWETCLEFMPEPPAQINLIDNSECSVDRIDLRDVKFTIFGLTP